MKRTLSLLAALVLATGLTACASNSAHVPNTAYDGYGTYGNPSSYNGSVSTTPNGRVNGGHRATKSTTSRTATTGRARTNTNAMGAGIRG